MASSTEIANIALSHLGISVAIADLETERSAEANACRRHFTLVVENALRSANWSFARATKAAQLIAENPTPNWQYAYRLPSDCITMQKIVNPGGNSLPPIPYELGADDTGQLILTNQAEATLQYTLNIKTPSRFPPDFTLAVSFGLAKMAANAVTGGDPFRLGDKAGASYDALISKAEAQGKNEEQPSPEGPSDLERSRL